MPLDFSLLRNPNVDLLERYQAGANVANQGFEQQNRLIDLMGNRDLRQLQFQQAKAQAARMPILQQREDLQWQAQQAEALRKQREEQKKIGLTDRLSDSNLTVEQQNAIYAQLYPEKVAEQRFKAPAVRDFNQPFLPTGEPNVPFQQYQRSLKQDIGEKPADRLAREKFEWEKSGGKTNSKPLPATALKMQNDAVDAVGAMSGLNADLGTIKSNIESGALNLGMFANLFNKARNLGGLSTEESRNLATFQSTLERLRNESLRLNKGVQTEGDAVRAWNEILNNINDPELVKQRLDEVMKTNQRAVELRKLEIDNIRANYGHDPLDLSQQLNVKPALTKTRGATGGWGEQQTQPQMNAMPPPQSATGKTVRDTSTGIRYKSDGSRWVRVE
ncbi:hypothetical protein [Caudoviricetes sp.]|nr:hypothetical protein [Caudoviricetes sp.]